MCARTCAAYMKKKTGRVEKTGARVTTEGGREAGGSGFCARDDKFGGQRFAPENLSQ